MKPFLYISFFLVSLFSFHTSAKAQAFQEDLSALADTAKDQETVLIHDIIIEGNRKTKNYIIEREFAFSKNDTLTQKELKAKTRQARQMLNNTSLFISVAITTKEISPGSVDVVVSVKERWYIFPVPYFRIVDRNFNTWWVDHNHDLERVNYGIKFTYNNVSGRNDKLLLWLLNGYTRQIQLRYSQPYADKKLKHGFSVGVSYARTREFQYKTSFGNKQVFFPDTTERNLYGLSFVREQLRFDASYIYRPGLKSRHYVRFAYVSDQVNDSAVAKNPNYFGDRRTKVHFPEIAYTFQYINTDYIYYPLRGFMADASFTARDPFGPIEMYQFEVNALQAYKLAKHTYINLSVSGTVKLPFDQPFYNRRISGYSTNYLRGLEYFVIDGTAFANFKSTIKYQLFDFKIKTPFKKSKNYSFVPFKIYLKAYGDCGYASTKNKYAGMLNNKLLYTGGLGLDIVSFYDFVLRFEYSFNQLNQSGLFLHYQD